MIDTKTRYSGIQSIAKNLNLYGCHFFVLLSIAEEASGKQIDLIDAIRVSMSKGWMQSDFYVKDGLAILNYYTGKKWTRSEKLTSLPAVIKKNQFTEVNYFNKNTGYEHFRRRGFDTIDNSITVRDGVIRYYYIYTYKE